MEYQLREYQKEAVKIAVEFLKGNDSDNAIQVLPTGSGKSLIIANIVKEIGEDVLIFQPSKEILEQNIGKLRSYGFEASIFSASCGEKEIGRTTFSTIGSAVKHPEIFSHFKYMIIDECHFVNSKKGMYNELISALKGTKILGLTATPYRLTTDGFGGSILKFLTRTRPRIFKKLIYYVQNKELFESGYLSKISYQIVPGFDSSKIAVNSTGADYEDRSVIDYYRQIDFKGKLIQKIKSTLELKRKNLLIFTRFIEESEFIVKNIPGAEIVTSETEKKERERIIRGFKAGEVKIVCNVGILTTGFDYPELDTIIFARPTMSLALYYQIIGRGIRPHPDKKELMVIDMCDNFRLFGKIEEFRIEKESKDLWNISNNERKLTNIYYSRGNEYAYQ